jgi:raffinose/stachyose/melibiose transport system substrate-binding protein
MKKSVTSLLALFMALTLVLAACGGNNNGNTTNEGNTGTKEPAANNGEQPAGSLSGELVFATHRTDLVDNGTYDKYVKKFQETYPDVKVTYAPYTNYEQDIRVKLTAGDAGDVLMIPGNIANADLGDFFAPLDDLGIFDQVRFPEHKAFEGKHYGVATGASTNGIVYNKKAFEAAGITAVPKTLDEFYAAAQKLKDAGIVPIYINYGAQWPMSQWGRNSLSHFSGDINFENDMVKDEAPFKMDNAWGTGLTIVRTLIEKGYVEPDLATNNWEVSKVEIGTAKAGMYFLGNWVINQIIEQGGAAPEDIGFFPFPTDNSGTANAPLGPDYFMGVSSTSKNMDAAKAFLKFMIMESGYDADAGFIPINKNNEPTLPQMAEFMGHNPNLLEGIPTVSEFNEIANKAQIPFTGEEVQQMAVAKDLQAEFDKLNAKWASAKKELGY